MGLSNDKFTDLKCLKCSYCKFEKFEQLNEAVQISSSKNLQTFNFAGTFRGEVHLGERMRRGGQKDRKRGG